MIHMRAWATATSLFVCLAVEPALAQSRPQSTRMTCGQAAALVFERGALVLGTGAHTYDRFVRHRGFCTVTEVTRPAFVPTLDIPSASSATPALSLADVCGGMTE